MSVKQAEELIKKYIAGTCTEGERALVESWHLQDIRESEFAVSPKKIKAVNARMRATLLNHAYDESQDILTSPKHFNLFKWKKMAAAAVVFFTLALSVYFYLNQSDFLNNADVSVSNDIAPIGNKATLTLANGSTIDLSADESGIMIHPDSIAYVNGATIAANSGSPQNNPTYADQPLLSLHTPKGSHYQVTLADGTKIWLNSRTRIQYPAVFDKKKRAIDVIEGEIYLQVAHNPKVPFQVTVNGQEIEVLGTEFNINAYSAKKTITTLVNGSVKVTKMGSNEPLILAPGEESVLEENRLFKRAADLNFVTAWKNDYFYFKNEPLQNVMAQVSEWYGVSIHYNHAFEQVRIGGFISRANSLKTLLALLEETGNFSLELRDSTVIVKSKK